jgi:hypothetical protein
LAGGGICRKRHGHQLGNLDSKGASRPCSIADSIGHRDANSERDSDCYRVGVCDCDRVGDSDRLDDRDRDLYFDDVADANCDIYQFHVDGDRYNHADCDCDRNRDGYCDSDRYSDPNANRYSDAAVWPNEHRDQPS